MSQPENSDEVEIPYGVEPNVEAPRSPVESSFDRKRRETNGDRHRRHYDGMRVELQKTIAGRYRNGESNYDYVGVLLICWQDDDLKALAGEIKRLENIFRAKFNFHVEQYRIPSERTLTGLDAKVSEFAHKYDSPNNLAIVYYGGHGTNEDNRLKLYARHKPNGEGHPQAFFDDVVYHLQRCDTDVLIITDCCYAALAFTSVEVGKRKFELLTATGPEQTAYAPQKPQSFTRHLCSTLEELDAEQGFTTSRLYRKLYFKADEKFKPFLFDQSIQDWGRISLRRLGRPGHMSEGALKDSGVPRLSRSIDTILQMELRLRSKPKPHNMNELARAMQYLPHVKEINFKRMYAPELELREFMRGVSLATTIRPLLKKLREIREAKRAARRRSVHGRDANAVSPSSEHSPHDPPEMYKWDNSELMDCDSENHPRLSSAPGIQHVTHEQLSTPELTIIEAATVHIAHQSEEAGGQASAAESSKPVELEQFSSTDGRPIERISGIVLPLDGRLDAENA